MTTNTETIDEAVARLRPLLAANKADVTILCQGEPLLLEGVVPRNIVGEKDFGFWRPGDHGTPRIWLTRGTEFFVPVTEVISFDLVDTK